MTLRVVFVDDDPIMKDAYIRNLQTELEGDFPEIEIRPFTDPAEAIAYIARKRAEIDLIVTDIFFAPEDRPDAPSEEFVPRGIDVVRKGAEQTTAAICAFSIGNLERHADLPRIVTLAGAHYFTYRQLIQDPTKLSWGGFGWKIRELLKQRGESADQATDTPLDTPHHLVFVALSSELAVLKKAWRLTNHYGHPYWEGLVTGCTTPIRVLPAHGAGRVNAATTTLRYLLSPAGTSVRTVTVLGICGGFTEADVKQGYVIVPEMIVDLGTRKVTCEDSPQFRLVPEHVGSSCLEVLRSGDFDLKAWTDDCTELPFYPAGVRPVLADGGAIICADEVVASDEWRKKLVAAWPKSSGVEMESGGVVAACRAAESHALTAVIRGVSDKADPLKTDDQWRTLAMQSVALLYARYIRTIG